MQGRLAGIGLMILVLSLAACDSAQNSASANCSGSLKISTGLGIGEGLELLGNLSFQIDPSGALSGNFAGGQSPIQVVGQVSGRSVNLAADLGGGKYLFGSGTAQSSADGCPAIAGGPLAIESAPAAGAGPAKLLAPSSQGAAESTGVWFYKGK